MVHLLHVVLDHEHLAVLGRFAFGDTLLLGSEVNVLVQVVHLLVNNLQHTIKVLDDLVNEFRLEQLRLLFPLLLVFLAQYRLSYNGAEAAGVAFNSALVVNVEFESALDVL